MHHSADEDVGEFSGLSGHHCHQVIVNEFGVFVVLDFLNYVFLGSGVVLETFDYKGFFSLYILVVIGLNIYSHARANNISFEALEHHILEEHDLCWHLS